MQYLLLIKRNSEFAFITTPISELNLILLSLVIALIIIVLFLLNRNRYQDKQIKSQYLYNIKLQHETQELLNEKQNSTEHLELAMSKSEEANQLKSLFLANMSHEIRTPLNGIMGFTELIVDDDETPSAKKLYAQYITQNSQNLLRLIDQIFHLSIIETGKVRVIKEDFTIAKFIRDIEKETILKINNAKKKIRLSVNVENEDYIIHSDKEKIKLILENLFDNAIKFTTHGIIELTCVRMEKAYLFQLTDSGTGINEDEYEVIFDPFTQGSETLRKIKGGSGLGLSNVKSYVILLGGKIWCERNKPNGAIFTFTIPAPPMQESEIINLIKYSLS